MTPKRYIIIEGSQSAHCCFDATVVDTMNPVIIGGKPYAPDGVQEYKSVCECFEVSDAIAICDAMNSMCEVKL